MRPARLNVTASHRKVHRDRVVQLTAAEGRWRADLPPTCPPRRRNPDERHQETVIGWSVRQERRLKKDRNLDQLADRNRGRVSRSALPKAALDNTPAAIRSPKDRIATDDHTPGVPRSCAAKRDTELRAAAAEADRNQLADHSRLAGRSGRLMAAGNRKADRRPVAGHTRLTDYSQVAGHKRKEDHRPVAGCTHLTGYSQVAAHSQVPAHRQKADRRREVHPRLRRDQEKLRWRTALPQWQSQ
jgi:hypothetical protein